MNYQKLCVNLCLAISVLGLNSTAFAYSDTSSDEVVGYFGAAVFVVLVVVMCYYILKFKGKRILSGLTKLKAKDPGFDEQAFRHNVSSLFFMVMQAWSGRDMVPVRDCMSEEAISYYNELLEKHIRKGTYNKLDELLLDKTEFMGVRSDAANDMIDIWLSAKAKDYVVDEQGNKVSGSANSFTSWDVKWTFARPLNRITPTGNVTADSEKNAFDWMLVKVQKINFDTGSTI